MSTTVLFHRQLPKLFLRAFLLSSYKSFMNMDISCVIVAIVRLRQ